MRSTIQPRVVIASERDQYKCRVDARVVRTSLDLIQALDTQPSICVAILHGQFARESAVAAFLRETYPDLRLLTVHEAN